MSAGNYNFTIEQGTTLAKQLTFYTDATRTTPEDLSAVTMNMQIRINKADEDAQDTLTDSNARIDVTNAATGIIILKWSAAQSAVLNFDTALYDLEFTSSGVVTRVLKGVITLDKEVSK